MSAPYQAIEQCFICLKANKIMISLQEVLLECDGFSVVEILERLHLLQIQDPVYLNQPLCFMCVAKIQICFEFKSLCSQTEQALRDQIGHKNTTPPLSISIVTKNKDDNYVDLTADDNQYDDNSDDLVDDIGHLLHPEIVMGNPNQSDEGSDDQQNIEFDDGIFSTTNNRNDDSYVNDYVEDRKVMTQLSCPHCPMKFRYNLLLNKHMESHTIERTRKGKYKCPLCPKEFDSPKGLRHHVVYHKRRGEIMKWKCNFCSKVFKHEGALKSHLRIHTMENQESSSYNSSKKCSNPAYINHYNPMDRLSCPQCQRRFKTNKILRNHIRTHTGEKPYVCHICNASFAWSSGYYRHMRKHREKKPYPCDICQYSFRTPGQLKQHMSVMHKHVKVKKEIDTYE